MLNKKRLAASILKTSPKKVVFTQENLGDISKAITRSDIRGLVAVGKIKINKSNAQSKSRARAIREAKKKGRRRNAGSRKGGKTSIVSRKESWMAKIRTQRKFLAELREKGILSPKSYRELYLKCKGGFFRNKRHIKLYMNEYKLVENGN